MSRSVALVLRYSLEACSCLAQTFGLKSLTLHVITFFGVNKRSPLETATTHMHRLCPLALICLAGADVLEADDECADGSCALNAFQRYGVQTDALTTGAHPALCDPEIVKETCVGQGKGVMRVEFANGAFSMLSGTIIRKLQEYNRSFHGGGFSGSELDMCQVSLQQTGQFV